MHSPFQLAAANVIFTGRESPYLQRVKCPRTTDAPFARSSSAVAHTTAISYSSCTCERARLNARGNYGGPAERRASVRCGSGCVNLRTSSRNLTRPCEIDEASPRIFQRQCLLPRRLQPPPVLPLLPRLPSELAMPVSEPASLDLHLPLQ